MTPSSSTSRPSRPPRSTRFGYTHQRGYHPILATRAGTGEVLHIRCRKGSANSARGALRFIEALIPRVARAGATGPKLLRADSGFWNKHTMMRLQRAGWTYSIGVRQQPHIKAAIDGIPEQDWQPLGEKILDLALQLEDFVGRVGAQKMLARLVASAARDAIVDDLVAEHVDQGAGCAPFPRQPALSHEHLATAAAAAATNEAIAHLQASGALKQVTVGKRNRGFEATD